MRVEIRKDVFLTIWWQLSRRWPVTVSKEEHVMVITIDDNKVAYELSAHGCEYTVVKHKGNTMTLTLLCDGTYTLDV